MTLRYMRCLGPRRWRPDRSVLQAAQLWYLCLAKEPWKTNIDTYRHSEHFKRCSWFWLVLLLNYHASGLHCRHVEMFGNFKHIHIVFRLCSFCTFQVHKGTLCKFHEIDQNCTCSLVRAFPEVILLSSERNLSFSGVILHAVPRNLGMAHK